MATTLSACDWNEIAKSAYEAYAEVTHWKNYQGNPMPQYEDLTTTIQQAWVAACKEVVRVSKNNLLARYPSGEDK